EPREVIFSGVSFTSADVDASGEVDITDALAAMRMALGIYDGITAERWFAADVDSDGGPTVSDVLLILRRAAQIA
ncbi:MAG: hypothetical protein IKS88_00655, partial [Clostridia bacterium]|nr:hypothetical protein [Clostridia bacterium]